MKICFVADGRSVIAKNWIRYFCAAGHEAHLISTFPCDPRDPAVASLHVVPLDFSAKLRSMDIGGKGGGLTTHGNPTFAKLRGNPLWKTMARLRDDIAPQAVKLQRYRVRKIIQQIQPDLVHAMRIPFEGILAGEALRGTDFPLVISVWGNDFTLFAEQSPAIARLTRRAMERADALHPDCERDLRLAHDYGLDPAKPSVVLPGNGGVRTDVFCPGPTDAAFLSRWDIPAGVPVVINPRGVKPYIRTDTFFQSIPLVLAKRPDVVFLGAMMEGNSAAENWIESLGIRESVRFLPFVTHDEMAQLFRRATITVSPADHDGTPNTLLEAMSCGTFPVAGNIESVREWIEDGVNGLLFDQKTPAALAAALLRAIEDDVLRGASGERNQRLIRERAAYDTVMPQAEAFYQRVAGRKREVLVNVHG